MGEIRAKNNTLTLRAQRGHRSIHFKHSAAINLQEGSKYGRAYIKMGIIVCVKKIRNAVEYYSS